MTLGAHVLVVEDDPAFRELLTRTLAAAGCRVEVAVDGQEALQLVRSSRPEVIVTDWEMPNVDGVTLCRLVKGTEELRNTHVLILSSRGETGSKVVGLDNGADDYLVKPVDPDELVARVRAGLRLQRALTDLAARNELLSRLALSDPLTGLANRRAFDEAIAREVARTARLCRPLSLLVLDLDRFKQVNDTYGHPTGDDVLNGLAALLARVCRRGDLPARLGGDEFAILLPHTGPEQALLVAERIRRTVEGAPLGRTSPVPMTVSIGSATLHSPEQGGPESLVARADAALYRSKSLGRNRVEAD
ncbi:diguanylate cyclase [Acidobacteria bacterium ACD]|nr:MAG: diguanylate cyclase [Acidobacteriota bacterium]MCE7957904.1 diguanylate cyclase [Acidobacteria bacterium ACB2]MDL1948599.1 diguanylate cyclase [Acidobacteria bacterium ACD]